MRWSSRESPAPVTVRELGLVGLLFLCLTLLWLWPFPAHVGTHLIAAPYWWDGQLNTYLLGEATRSLWTAPWDLFQARILHPVPDVLAFSENLLGFAIPAGLLRLVGASPLTIHGSLLILGIAGTGLAIYAWLRRRTSPLAALIGAALFTFAPFRLGYLGRIQLAVGFGTPCILIAAERLMEAPSWRRAAVVGGLVSLQCGFSLYGVVHLSLLLVPTVLLWGVWRLASDRTLRSWRLGATTAVALLVTLAPAALIAKQYVDVSQAQGFQRDDEMLAGTSGRHADLVTTSDMLAHGAGTPWVVDEASAREAIACPGLTLAVLAGVGLCLALAWRSPGGPLFGNVTYALWLPIAWLLFLGTGPDAPGGAEGLYGWLRDHVPGLGGFRYSSRFVALATLPMALLAAEALHRIGGWLGSRRAAAIMVALSFGAAWELTTKGLPLHEQEPMDPAYAWVADTPGGDALVEIPGKGGLHQNRVLQNLGALVHGLPTLSGYTGYDPPILRYARERLDAFPDAASEELLRSLGVDRVIVHLHALQPAAAEEMRAAVARTPWLAVRRDESGELLLEVADVPDGAAAAVREAAQAYARRPPTPPAHSRADWTLIPGEGCHNPEDLRDGDPVTRFTTGQPQVAGRPWIIVRFPAPRVVSEVWFDLRQGALDSPLGLRVEGLIRSETGEESIRVLYESRFHAPVVPLAAAPSAAFDRVVFTEAEVVGLRLSSMADSPDRWGSIHELWVGP